MNRAEELVREEGLTLVPPYDHPIIIAGQGTVGLEIAADVPNVDAVLLPNIGHYPQLEAPRAVLDGFTR